MALSSTSPTRLDFAPRATMPSTCFTDAGRLESTARRKSCHMKKDFDCVEMKRKGAERVLEQTRGMTVEQELEFWRAKTERLLQKQREETDRFAQEKKSA